MARRTEPTTSRIASLPRDFDPVAHLAHADRTQAGAARIEADARFFGKVLGRKRGLVYVETDEGVYQFKQDHVREIRPLHRELDMVTISREATFVMHGTIARALRSSALQEERRVSDAEIEQMVQNRAPLREIVDTLGGLGTREWRG
jgi:hypothetical protein